MSPALLTKLVEEIKNSPEKQLTASKLEALLSFNLPEIEDTTDADFDRSINGPQASGPTSTPAGCSATNQCCPPASSPPNCKPE